MKLLPALALLLSLQLCAPAAQVRKQAKTKTAPPAKAAAPSKTEAPAKTEAAEPGPSARTIVCIDPGHPSEVASGKNVQNGTSETAVDWAVAEKLREALEARGYEVVLTKSAEEELVRNKERALIANRARAALMIRLHCDASTERGFAVYYPDRPGRAKDGTTGPARDVIEESRRAAEAVHAGLADFSAAGGFATLDAGFCGADVFLLLPFLTCAAPTPSRSASRRVKIARSLIG